MVSMNTNTSFYHEQKGGYNIELMFDIEDAMMEADVLRSTLLAVTVAAYEGGYAFDTYEAAFNYVCSLACEHFKHLKELTDKAFALKDTEKPYICRQKGKL